MRSIQILEQNFRDFIIEKCKFCHFDKYLEENPDFEFPKITEELLSSEQETFISIPGMFGGFAYYLEKVDDEPVLYTEQSSRMDYSSDSYLYFEITTDGDRALEGEEREAVKEKFGELTRKAHEKHLQKLKIMRKQDESSKRK